MSIHTVANTSTHVLIKDSDLGTYLSVLYSSPRKYDSVTVAKCPVALLWRVNGPGVTNDKWKERVVSTCLAHNIAVYSPHTTWDAIQGGINDWLASIYNISEYYPLVPSKPEKFNSMIAISHKINETDVVQHLTHIAEVAFGPQQAKESVTSVILILSFVISDEIMINSIAVCAGSGGELLRGKKADLYITGEMSHHDVLDATHRGTTVLLLEHSDSERPFLQTMHTLLQIRLWHYLDWLKIYVSKADKDPIGYV
ncbi:NIF3-like protein 1 [Diaphorina citri]|uniref:NIF3-like protein 1 n=1 Tax=Diaphorina citri TaxID=121845 RepID=A0A3Q0JAI5_DIACI|nr:NIF3-like protein 1 [Diaphorina citri]